ncbi:hypothetical protein G5I_03080 [Acromyrmex echinatior]|uniref:Uncharacterized protein n=1 Tax=Acromyrmex echinatior TaxID=103372 RepID=F4WC09_ACREC|nr:hypothetical protein G5I_03080 [Acromyrmex echinatior]
MRTDENPHPSDPEGTGNPPCRSSVSLSDLTAFFDRILTDSNTVDTISNDVSEGSVDQIEYTVTVSDIVPVLDLADKSSFDPSRPSPHMEIMEIDVPFDKINISDPSGSKKSFKRRADKEAPNASAKKMQAPSLPSYGTSSSFPVKYQHIDSSYVVHFCRASEIPSERINALNSWWQHTINRPLARPLTGGADRVLSID